jgi:hypothetical protein
MTGKAISVLIMLLLMTGCATSDVDLQWPEGAYPRSYFEAAFQEDEAAREYQTRDNYLLWVTRFYNGYSLAPGWLNLTAQVMARLEPQGAQRQAEVRERLYHLGGRIGSEWAKSNEVRVLDTRNAAVWRDALIESINQNDLDNYMTRVENDVESMFAGELGREDIYFERYYVDDFEF